MTGIRSPRGNEPPWPSLVPSKAIAGETTRTIATRTALCNNKPRGKRRCQFRAAPSQQDGRHGCARRIDVLPILPNDRRGTIVIIRLLRVHLMKLHELFRPFDLFKLIVAT